MKLEYLMEYYISLTHPPDETPVGPYGNRRIYTFNGGSFEGPRLKGKILPGGGDWLLRGADGIGRADYRANLETDDGALVYLQLHGINRVDPARPKRPEGEPSCDRAVLARFFAHCDEFFGGGRVDADRGVELCFGCAAFDRHCDSLDDLGGFRAHHVTADHPIGRGVHDDLHHGFFVATSESVFESPEGRPIDVDFTVLFSR